MFFFPFLTEFADFLAFLAFAAFADVLAAFADAFPTSVTFTTSTAGSAADDCLTVVWFEEDGCSRSSSLDGEDDLNSTRSSLNRTFRLFFFGEDERRFGLF